MEEKGNIVSINLRRVLFFLLFVLVSRLEIKERFAVNRDLRIFWAVNLTVFFFTVRLDLDP